MVNPLSAMTRSPGNNFSITHQFSVKNLSEVLPPQALETNEMVPCGVIPIRTLTVLWCLLEEKICAHARRFEGLSIKTSKQSMITVVLLMKTGNTLE